jgi:hypothetical protein
MVLWHYSFMCRMLPLVPLTRAKVIFCVHGPSGSRRFFCEPLGRFEPLGHRARVYRRQTLEIPATRNPNIAEARPVMCGRT